MMHHVFCSLLIRWNLCSPSFSSPETAPFGSTSSPLQRLCLILLFCHCCEPSSSFQRLCYILLFHCCCKSSSEFQAFILQFCHTSFSVSLGRSRSSSMNTEINVTFGVVRVANGFSSSKRVPTSFSRLSSSVVQWLVKFLWLRSW